MSKSRDSTKIEEHIFNKKRKHKLKSPIMKRQYENPIKAIQQ